MFASNSFITVMESSNFGDLCHSTEFRPLDSLIAAVLFPLYDILKAWSFLKRFLYVASLYLVLGFWAATVAAPGTLEGMVYMRPFITPEVHLRVQPKSSCRGWPWRCSSREP